MTEKHYPEHRTGKNDDLLVTMAHHGVSFEVHYFRNKLFVKFGSDCGLQLTLQQAQALRTLLDAGIADFLDAQQARASRVDLVKAVA